MPLDPSIPLRAGGQPIARTGLLQTLGSLAQLSDQEGLNDQRRLVNEQHRRELDDDTAIRDTLQRTQNPDAAIDELYSTGRANAAGTLSAKLFAHRKAQSEEAERHVTSQKKAVDFAAQIAQSADDQGSWDSARTAMESVLKPIMPELLQHIPQEYDPKKQQELVDAGTAISDKLKAHNDAIQNVYEAARLNLQGQQLGLTRQEAQRKADEHSMQGASTLLGTANSQDEWDGYVDMLKKQGTPPAILEQFGGRYSPEAIKRARALGMTPKDRAEVEGAAAGRAETARHDRATEDQRGRAADDPALPSGVSDYLVSLRDKYDKYSDASGEFARALPDLRAAHPRLSSGKALDQLRRSFIATGGRTNELDTLIADALKKPGDEPKTPRSANRPGTPAPNARQASPATGLEDRARQILEASGYDSSPDSIRVFLSKPENRRRLSGGQ